MLKPIGFALLSLLLIQSHVANGEADSVSLLGGRYNTSNDVADAIKLASDISSMKQATDSVTREEIYRGTSLNTYDGESNITLESLSLYANETMIGEPIFSIYNHFFKSRGLENNETEGYYLGRQSTEYADSFLSDLFDRDISDSQTDAALILHVWMYITHELHAVYQSCGFEADASKALAALDRAATAWTGLDQLTGNSTSGHLLYNLAESAGARFGQSGTVESKVNSRVIENFIWLQNLLVEESYCTDGSDMVALREYVLDTVSIMSVPLLQDLIHHVLSGSSTDVVRTYAAAVLPQISACDTGRLEDLSLTGLESMTKEETTSWVSSLQESLVCFRLSCSDVGQYTLADAYPTCSNEPVKEVDGYTISDSLAISLSKLDRDLVTIDLMLSEEAYDSALDVYKFGYFSEYSIRDLALNELIPQPNKSYFDLYRYYHGNGSYDFLNQEVTDIMTRAGEFQSLSSEQVQEMAMGILRYETMFLSIARALLVSQETCGTESIDANETVVQYWDVAAAMYVGSLAKLSNGQAGFMYGTSEALCDSFNECMDGTSRINNLVMQAFSEGLENGKNGDCERLTIFASDLILPSLQVTLIQGSMLYAYKASKLQSDSGDGVIGSMHSFASSILPLVHESNILGTTTLESNLLYVEGNIPVEDGIYAVADSFYTAMPDMDVNCDYVGSLQPLNLNVCDPALPQYYTNNITFGRYSFSGIDNVDSLASLAFDVRDILESESIEEAISIYEQGLNSVMLTTTRASSLVSLQSLSTGGEEEMSMDPMYNIFKYSLYGDDALENPRNQTFTYADDAVLALFNARNSTEMAAQGIVTLNVWMVIMHHLNEVIQTCSLGQNPLASIDAAVALWIGKGQIEGSSEAGWLLYGAAQRAAELFGHKGKEAAVNSDLMERFVELQTLGGECVNDSSVHRQLRWHVREISRLFTLPLLQLMFHAMATNNDELVGLYAMSVVPQSSACSPSIHEVLTNTFYTSYTEKSVGNETITNLENFLRCLRVSEEDLAYTEDAPSELKSIMASVTDKLGVSHNSVYLPVGDDDSTLVLLNASHLETTRLDMDILQIEIFLKTQAYDAAADCFLYGRNAFTRNERKLGVAIKSLLSLNDLASLQSQNPVNHLTLFTDYFASNSYSQNFVLQGINRIGVFANATRQEVASSVPAFLNTMVSYQGIVWYMQQAVENCYDDQYANELLYSSLSLILGSLTFTKQPANSGYLLRALGAQQCQNFGTCVEESDSSSNVALYKALMEVKNQLAAQNCMEAQEVFSDSFLPALQVPIAQSSASASYASSDTSSIPVFVDFASGFAYAQSILPVIEAVNSASAATIAHVFSSLSASGDDEEIERIFDAFKFALPALNVDCATVGTFVPMPALSICQDYDESLGSSVSLGLAAQIAEMKLALDSGDVAVAKSVYEIGGASTANVTSESLQTFHSNILSELRENPIYNLFVFSSGNNSYGDPPSSSLLYADNFVKSELARTAEESLAAEAAVVLQVWMYAVNSMQKAVGTCDQQSAKAPTLEHLNEMAAYWIGDADTDSDGSFNGNLMYDLAEKVGDYFEVSEGNILTTNEHILTLFAEAKYLVDSLELCSGGVESALILQRTMKELLAYKTIPLFQFLVHSLKTGDKDRVRLYARAVLPLLASCDPDEYGYLGSQLLEATYGAAEVEGLVDRLYAALPCLSLTCQNVGQHISEVTSGVSSDRCGTSSSKYSTYIPVNSVDYDKYNRIDMDVREVDILTRMEAYTAATHVFLYGHHTETSLNDLAISSDVSGYPDFESYVEYYSSSNYGKEIISEVLSSGTDLSDAQKPIMTVRNSQMLLIPQAALDVLYKSATQCTINNTANNYDLMEYWDQAAGLLLGSVDRASSFTQSERCSPFDLAQEQCREFGTCASSGLATVNSEITELFYSGRGALVAGNCEYLLKVVGELRVLLLIPIVQSTLSAAFELSESEGRTGEVIAESVAASRVLTPLVQSVNPSAAEKLEKLLPPLPSKVNAYNKETGVNVMYVLAQVYDDLEIDCTMIGARGYMDPCYTKKYQIGAGKSTPVGLIIGLLAAVVVLLAMVYFLLYRRRQHKRFQYDETSGLVKTSAEQQKELDSSQALSESSRHQPASEHGGSGSGSDYSSGTGSASLASKQVEHSFRRQRSTPMSKKATKALRRINKYGDDDASVLPLTANPRRGDGMSINNESTIRAPELV
eukprot:Nitzschia sp. Nitz4//scaffold227_size32659//16278//23006//NITZ4_007900-RA/size32659-augustus-gene-0.11-mRNA-1//-1//CDS//3329542800//2852//frame0